MPTEETGNLKEQLREQYANDNEGYVKALKDNNIAVSNPNGKVRSIQQAYYDGGIDKSTRDYMMADAIAKFARNTGRDIGNIGAQFTGGAINNNYETPSWNDRNTELFKQQTSAEAAGIENSDKGAQRRQQNANATSTELSNEKNNRVLDFSRNVKKMAEDARKKGDENTAIILDYLAASEAGGNLNYTDLAGALAARNLGTQNPGVVGSKATDKDRSGAFNELKAKYPDASDEDIINAIQEAEKMASNPEFVNDKNKQIKRGREIENELKEKSKAAKTYNEAVNYFTTDQRFLNDYPTMKGFNPDSPTPEQIQLLKNLASKNKLFSKADDYARSYLTKMGL